MTVLTPINPVLEGNATAIHLLYVHKQKTLAVLFSVMDKKQLIRCLGGKKSGVPLNLLPMLKHWALKLAYSFKDMNSVNK